MALANPVHPGEYLKEVYMVPQNMSITSLASKLSVSPSAVSRLVNGKGDLSCDMAIKLSKAFNRSAKAWMNMQVDYNLSKLQ